MPDIQRHRDGNAEAPRHVAAGVFFLLDRLVNVTFVGVPGAGDRAWVLVDAGLPGSADRIARAAASLFGADARPAAILLTHGHVDHVGAIHTLARQWDAPVYAHELELPYLTGRSSYPPADPFAGGGALSVLSVAFPRKPINLGSRIHALPLDGGVPGLPGWRWVPTPGHSPGHVSYVRDSDRVLIAGDAFATTRAESLVAAMTRRAEVHGPPAYFTADWDAARRSVRHLAAYAPTAVVAGHGPPMRGERLQSELRALAADFDHLARPAHGRYRDRPAVADASGVVDVPPPVVRARTILLGSLAVGAAVGLTVALRRRDGAEGRPHAPTPREQRALDDAAALAAADGGYDASDRATALGTPRDATPGDSADAGTRAGAADVPAPAVPAPPADSASAAPSYIDLR